MNDLRFMELVSNWLDGSLTETESAELQAMLESSADRRSEFVDVCGLDADLRLMSDVVIEEIESWQSIFGTKKMAVPV